MPTGSAALRRLAMDAVMGAVMAAAIAVVVVAALPRPAAAQQVAVIVNGAPITTYDIEQRMKFNMLATHKPQSRQEAIQELIDDKLKVQIGDRYKLDVTDSQVDSQFATISQRMHLSAQQLTAQLAQAGIDAQTLKDKLRADISWQQIVRGKFQSSLQIRDKDVFQKLAESNQPDKKETGYEYTLLPILFIVQAGAPEAAIDGRKREAEQLRSRFENCRDGTAFARALRDVAIREPIVKSSADLAPAYRKMLDDLDVGKLTSPDVTPQGIQMFALCQRKQKDVDGAASREVRDQMFAQRFQEKSKQYLEVLRKGAMIEVK
ncbi:MAG TPA: SurA N-terminal domain-containing protein [Xanthobacteraceae bacterium]|nr:SurA N-terminal domain-containing protein [Xanthobacteraceae bacterium]